MAMQAPLDELLEAWQRQPDEQTALSLCEELELSRNRELIDEIGKRVSTAYASNPALLLAVARMYLRVRRLGDAQGLLVAAGRIAPKNADVYRWLGEVLLRRGDADRALKVLERAIALGKTDNETAFWRHQAEAHTDLQKQQGTQAVVIALAKVVPPLSSSSRPPPPPASRPSNAPPSRAPQSAPRTGAMAPPPSSRTAAAPNHVGSLSSARPPPAFGAGAPSSSRRPVGPPPLPPQSKSPPSAAPTAAENGSSLPAFDFPAASRSPLAEASSVLGRRPSTRPPPPRDLLRVFADTGVFEPSGGSEVAWAAAPRTKIRFSFALLMLTVMLIGAGTAIYLRVRDRRAANAALARDVDAEVATSLRGGQISELKGVEEKLSRAFDLDPNSPKTALLWVQDRVLRSLETGAEEQGIDSAIGRARQAGVPEVELAFARVGSFLAQNDTAGAIAILPQWDAAGKNEPYFQLLAGAALERAGDLRAIERYELATKLDPGLAAAHILLTRAVVLSGDNARATELLRSIRNQWPGRAEAAALVALAWARDPARGAAPPEVEQAKARRDDLPVALRTVPGALEALEAVQKGTSANARAALEGALVGADSPGVATWLGSVALQLDEDALARQAALRAVAFSAVYPPARILAARVALVGGRIDEATSAVSELDPSIGDVAIVRAASAYERLDAGALDLALDALPAEYKSRPELAALLRAPDVLRGVRAIDANRVRAMIAPDTAWSDLVALDAALDSGNLVLAKELIDKFGDSKGRPPRALRVARYLRYVEKVTEAESLSLSALGLLSARSLIERVQLLLATSRADDARALVAKNALALGPMASWVSAYIDAEGPRSADARARAALLDPPAASAPLCFRVLAALALSDLGDRRRGAPAVRALARDFGKNPDVLAAQKMLRR